MYRLYTKSLFDRLAEHELSEVHRQPLSEVVLRMRVMLDDDHKNDKNKSKNKSLTKAAAAGAAAVRAGGNDKDKDGEEDVYDPDNEDNEDAENEPDTESTLVSSTPLWKCDGVVAVLMALLEPPEMDQVHGLGLGLG